MSDLNPTDVWGEILSVDLTDEEQTLWEDGWDDGYDAGYRAALVEAVGVVTALFVANVDAVTEDVECG